MTAKYSRPAAIKLTEQLLRKLSGDVYFERGADYHRNGAVAGLWATRLDITARVQGSIDAPYLVRFWQTGQDLKWGCACPLGVDGAFCKHLVAAGLAWIDDHVDTLHMEPDLESIIADLRTTLAPIDREQLLDMLVQRAIWDESFLEELHLIARSTKNRQ